MALDRLRWDLLDRTKELGLQQSIQYVERLMVEADTNSIPLTPTVILAATTIALTSQLNTARGFLEFPINRIGPLDNLILSPFAGIDWFSVELYLRPVELRINIIPQGASVSFSGRSTDITTNIVFDVQPFAPTEDPRIVYPVIRRFYIDAETGTGSFTPVLTFDDGSTQSLAVVDTAGRVITEYSIIGAKRLSSVELTGDFSSDQIVLYSVEADLYVPSKRRMAIG